MKRYCTGNKFYISRLADAKDLPLPKYQSDGAAGMDLYANVTQPVTLPAGCIQLIPTGVKIALAKGYEAQIRPRSGLALKFGVTMVNSPGTIDADYRGEVKVILINHGQKEFIVTRGMRIAQMVISQVARITWEEAEVLEETTRNEGGFGHTGLTE